MRRRKTIPSWSLGIVLLVSPALATGTATEAFPAGTPLVRALETLRDAGLPIVFTSRFVHGGMKLSTSVPGGEPRRVLEELLAAHGLQAIERPSGVLVVSERPASPSAPAPASPRSNGEPETVPSFVMRDEIFVRPSRLALLQETTDSTFALDRREIDALPHLGGDVFRATSLLPGIAGNDVSAQFSIRGGRRDEVRILLDGQELYEAYHLKDHDSALSLVAAEVLAGATLTTGALPANHGDRLSGVLDLRTASPEATGRRVLGLSMLDATVSVAGRSGSGERSWLASGRRGSLDLARRAIGDQDAQFWDAFGRADTSLGRGVLAGRFLLTGDRLEVAEVEGEDFERLRNRYRTAYAWLTHQTAIGGDGSLETLASWSDIEQQRNGAVSEEKGEFTLLDRRDARIFGLSQTLTLGESGLGDLLSVGWEGRRFDADFDYEKNLEPDFRILAPFAGERPDVHHFDERLEGHHLGLWVIERLSPLDRLITEIGLRYDRHDSTDETLLSPRLSAAWSLGERSVLRAAWGRFAQSQRPYELEIADGATQLARSERARQWVMGYETMLRRPRLGALAWNALRFEAYRRDTPKPRRRFENLLEPVNFFPEAEPDRVLLEPTQSRAWGVEMLARGGRSRISWWLAYSYARSEDRFARDAGPSAGSGRFVPRGMDQPHAVTLDVDWRLSESWRINAAWRYHTGWPITPVSPLDGGGDEEAGAVFGALASRRLPAYHRLDLRLSRRADLRLGTLTLFLDLQNAYDRANVSGIDVSIDEDLPDGFELLAEYWPGIVPSVGVRWDF